MTDNFLTGVKLAACRDERLALAMSGALAMDTLALAKFAQAQNVGKPPPQYRHLSEAPLQLGVNARDLGIHSKRTGEDYRGVAYAHKVPATALAGGASAAAFKGLTGSSPLEAARRASQWLVENQGRTLGSMAEGAGQRVGVSPEAAQGVADKVKGVADKAKTTSVDDAVAATVRKAQKAQTWAASQRSRPVADVAADVVARSVPAPIQDAARNAARNASGVLPADLAAKRLRSAGKAGLVGAGVFGAGKALYNMASYHGAKSVTPTPNRPTPHRSTFTRTPSPPHRPSSYTKPKLAAALGKKPIVLTKTKEKQLLVWQARERKGKTNAVESSNLERVSYNPGRQTLTVEFRKGGLYRYKNVSPDKVADLLKAESHGKYFHKNIKTPEHPYQRLV